MIKATTVLAVLLASTAVHAGGIASVFCDRVTASGHGMNCGAMVAAHRTLPLGSRLHVCGPRACGIVTIVDRGPYVRGRVLDLSPGAARTLGVNGLGHVSF